jgi:hypothetical protein
MFDLGKVKTFACYIRGDKNISLVGGKLPNGVLS